MLSIILKIDFSKLVNNSFYGKTIGNLRKSVKIRFNNNAKDYKKYVSKPCFVLQKIFSKTFIAILETKLVLILDKPIYVGCSILDLRKLFHVWISWEIYLKEIYLCYAKLLFIDKDSLVSEIETDDVYEDFYENNNLFDFSAFSDASKVFDPVDKKIIGKMKDKVTGKIISKLVGLKSKMYSLIVVGSEEIRKAIGVSENVVKNIRHKEYIDVLFNHSF